MSSLYTATEFGTDLQTLGFLGHHAADRARIKTFKKSLGLELPRVGRWLVRVATKHAIGQAELSGWVIGGEQRPEPAGLPTLLAAIDLIELHFPEIVLEFFEADGLNTVNRAT